MTLGQKIKKLRSDKGLTQKDLADRVHVTFQTISKWENDDNEPDVSTLRELAKVFDCSLDYLLSEEDEIQHEESTVETVAAPAEQATKTIIIHQKEPHVCSRCKKDIDENDLVMEEICVRPAGRGRSAEYRSAYYHKDCLEEVKKERRRAAAIHYQYRLKRAKKIIFAWSIVAAIAFLGISLGVFFGVETTRNAMHPVAIVFLSLLISYGGFATLYCILAGSYVGDIFITVASWSIKFPGLIFSWSLEGFAWLIAMKILFAILGFLATLAAIAFATLLSMFCSIFSFPYLIVKNENNGYADSLVGGN